VFVDTVFDSDLSPVSVALRDDSVIAIASSVATMLAVVIVVQGELIGDAVKQTFFLPMSEVK